MGRRAHLAVLMEPRRIFLLLILYRWISLIPPVVSLLVTPSTGQTEPLLLSALLVAIALNLSIFFFHNRLNELLLERPWLLGVDLVVAAGLIAITGGWRTPYYLYALSPLLAAAFFFQLRGVIVTASSFVPLYLVALLVAAYRGEQPSWLVVVMAIVGVFLLGGTLGFAAELLERLRAASDDLVGAHRDLEVIHDLTLSLQSAADVTEVEERVLEAVTSELGFKRAVVALVDQEDDVISAWLGRKRDGSWDTALQYSARLPVGAEGGVVGEVLQDGRAYISAVAPLTADEDLNGGIGLEKAHIFPLMLREHSVGVLLVDSGKPEEDAARFQSLQAIANQAAVSLGTTMMCIDRAQRLAVQEERIRIARDIHDTVSQSLFGIVYTLDGCLKLLPAEPETVKPELQRVLSVAEDTMTEIRKSILDIWPSEITADHFEIDLRRFVTGICLAEDLRLDFQLSGDFERLTSSARRGLYRISQEALANISHHAAASEAQICLQVGEDRAVLTIQDNGRGFVPEQALKRAYGRDHFGLWGMQERARSLDGDCVITSQPGIGSTVSVNIPVS